MSDDKIDYSEGYDRGNYHSAYESEDFAPLLDRLRGEKRSAAYQSGALLGHYSSFELCEVPREWAHLVAITRRERNET